MPDQERITVPLGDRPYDIVLGTGLADLIPDLLRSDCPASRYILIADETVAGLHAEPLLAQVRKFAPASLITFPAGEPSKSRTQWARITDLMLQDGVDRDAAVIALGGGVTGDLAGFVAATYLRGLDVVQVPTSLLAMIDSSIGGKTGVNTDQGKNLVGAFHQPRLVVIDTSYLSTLPKRQLKAGLAEALKHGVIADAEYFTETVANAADLLAGAPEALARVIHRSLVIKSAVVVEDERESGRRAILNFGHTVGHAVEIATNYEMLHGECIAVGMIVEAQLAVALEIADAGLIDAVRTGISGLELPTTLPAVPTETLLSAMRHDKKNRSGKLRFSLPERLGSMARAESGSWTIPVEENVTKRIIKSTS